MDARNLTQILIEEMRKYAGEGLNAHSYFTENEAEKLYTIVDIANVRGINASNSQIVLHHLACYCTKMHKNRQ